MPQALDRPAELSVVILVPNDFDDLKELYTDYCKELDTTGLHYEVIFTIDGINPVATAQLEELQKSSNIKIVSLSKHFGETTAVNAAIDAAEGNIILTLPAHKQIEPGYLPKIISKLKTCDMVLVRRWPRIDSTMNRLQTRIFNALTGSLSSLKINDVGCGVRAFKRNILDEISLYGDMYRFLPILAHRQGFHITQIDAPQSRHDTYARHHPPGIYIRRLLDLLGVIFVSKFLKKPLRFFGLIGVSLSASGLFITLYLVIERLFFNIALSDRPALFLASLLIVLGIQIIAIGLIGEILVFTHAKNLKEYVVDRIVQKHHDNY